MNRKDLATSLMSLFLVLIAGASTSSATERASASPTVVSSSDSGDGDDAALPARVSAEWWAHAQTAIRQSQQPNSEVAAPVRPRANWKAEGDQDDAYFGYS